MKKEDSSLSKGSEVFGEKNKKKYDKLVVKKKIFSNTLILSLIFIFIFGSVIAFVFYNGYFSDKTHDLTNNTNVLDNTTDIESVDNTNDSVGYINNSNKPVNASNVKKSSTIVSSGGGGSGGGSGDSGGTTTCTPKTCSDYTSQCGNNLSDGCSGFIDCSNNCNVNETCYTGEGVLYAVCLNKSEQCISGSANHTTLGYFPNVCLINGQLNESYCYFNSTTLKTEVKNRIINCTYGCKNSACVLNCTPNLVNITSAWTNISCLSNNLMNQSKTIVQYDNNSCGTILNQTFVEYRATLDCTVPCTPNLFNITSAWTNISCLSNDKMNQSRNITQYDSNNCGTIANKSFIEYKASLDCDYSLDIEINLATLKYNYGIGEQINLTDPPESADAFKVSSLLKEKSLSASSLSDDYLGIYSENSIIVNVNKNLKAIDVTGYFELNNPNSYARVIAVDSSNKDILVYGSDNILIKKGKHEFSEVCDETCLLNSVYIQQIKIELKDAIAYISKINLIEGTEVSISTLSSEEDEKEELRIQAKISSLREYVADNNLKWTPGDTPVLRMSYSEKKRLFGGVLPNLQGYEAYKGGLFEIMYNTEENNNSQESYNENTNSDDFSYEPMGGPDDNPYSSYDVSGIALPSSFDYRNRHNQSWLTPVRNQGGCGSCWAFGSVGATEGMINLYFNQHINADLSEQDLVSCDIQNDGCNGGNDDRALFYIYINGIVNETCFPYKASNVNCSNKCVTNQVWKIGDNRGTGYGDERVKKGLVFYGTGTLHVSSWRHVVTAVGYNTTGGKLYIIYKNSWGSGWGDKGYGQMLYSPFDMDIRNIKTPIIPPSNLDLDVLCVDNDSDNYCSWGVGEKPATCPENCNELEDFDDSNSSITILENCMISGDEDNNDLSDCMDNVNCPSGTLCDSSLEKYCSSNKSCVYYDYHKIYNKNFTMNNISYYVMDMTKDSGDNIYIAGYMVDSSILINNNYKKSIFVFKFDRYGNSILNTTIPYVLPGNYSYINDIKIDNGDIYLAGYYDIRTSTRDYVYSFMAKYDSSGNMIWNVSNNDTQFTKITLYNDSLYGAGINYGYYTCRYNKTNGSKIWCNYFNPGISQIDRIYNIASDKDGSVYNVGRAHQMVNNDWKYYLVIVKYALNGTRLWNVSYTSSIPLSSEMESNSIITDNMNNLYIGGIIFVKYSSDIFSGTKRLGLLLKFNGNGNLLFAKTFYYGYGLSDYINDLYYDSENNSIWAVGDTYLNSFFFKFSPSGNILYNRTFENIYPDKVILDNEGNIIISGCRSFIGYPLYYGKYGTGFSDSTCGNDIQEYGEECDGSDDSSCNDRCSDICTCLPMSKITNSENHSITGNLIMKLQKNNGGWVDVKEVINKEIVIPAHSTYKLDIGGSSDGWNFYNVVINEIGNYRVNVSFESNGKIFEKNWEFSVSGGLGSLGIFDKIADWVEGLFSSPDKTDSVTGNSVSVDSEFDETSEESDSNVTPWLKIADWFKRTYGFIGD
jgi:C1A family cysteine protease